MKKFVKALFVALFVAVSLPLANIHAQGKKVVTTFYPVYYLANRIAGDKMEVSMLLDQGQGAHGYESTAQDAVKVQEADLFIYLDDEMEFFVPDLLELVDQNKTKVVKTTEGMTLLAGSDHGVDEHDHEAEEGHDHEAEAGHDHEAEAGHDHEAEAGHDHEAEAGHDHEAEAGHDHEGHHHEYDPHTWLDPKTYAQQAENVKKALVELDPDNAATYEDNAAKLVEELTALDQEYKSSLASLEKRTMIVQHAAFGYLAHAYDLDQVAITGLNTTEEPSAQVIAQMQEFMKEQNSKVIFVDPALSENIAQTVASATDAELLPLRTLEVVTQDEMKAGVDYFSLMRENLQELLKNK
ncbi:metal ABC transporter solute-binding protein, Zn/Mn family [Ignavigranum ruoffiae]|uniref:metal ABC transporter solute-binding protein, Zn/Mn family n=1 Tax=Ignavigranum ruoffiae TaxID=89093 RepID=UPI0024ACFE19|nr:zinc ABC transporter substrate-binding protein [Ignavigranum ruoffiae]